MPCESCNVQFTVFKRKRPCHECRRLYCNQCLVKQNEKNLCERCVIFTTRPISKVDLLKLKPKDLIFYLQSKHISTKGCVEKEELVSLILAHINSASASSSPMSNGGNSSTHSSRYKRPTAPPMDDSENCSNPFDHIKQTCQNLFTSFTEKMSNDFNFESKTSPTASNSQQNIFTQPRAQTREMPSYHTSLQVNMSTCQFQQFEPNQETKPASGTKKENKNKRSGTHSSSSSSGPSSPIVSISSLSTHSLSSQAQGSSENRSMPNVSEQRQQQQQQQNPQQQQQQQNNPQNTTTASPMASVRSRRIFENIVQDASGSGCECSDDEIMIKFHSRNQCPPSQPESVISQEQSVPEKISPTSQTDSAFEDQIAGPSSSVLGSATASKSSTDNPNRSSEESSGSSFEELGAVGGITSSDNERWQFVNKTDAVLGDTTQITIEGGANIQLQQQSSATASTSSSNTIKPSTFLAHSSVSNLINSNNISPRLIRRRSDGSVYHRQTRLHGDHILSMQLDEESDEGNSEEALRKRSKKSCHKCGKSKKSLKKYLIKFKRQLESTEMSEADVKREVEAFLEYLEHRSKGSFDFSDSESNIDLNETRSNTTDSCSRNARSRTSEILETLFDRSDDGIHVYAHNDDYNAGTFRHDNRFINLGDFSSRSDFDDLSVKQLKEILMLNRVDFKGCCEKQELLDRVHRLWTDLQTTPAIDKLTTDDLCKICMDAPIECVILECGHMATCTNCGKVLSECPICRQYIVRVVRFFRA